MKHIYKLCLLLVLLFCLSNCTKDERLMYNEEETGLSFYKRGGTDVDSVDYSFALEPQDVKTDTIFLRFRIMGTTKSYDREIKLNVLDGSTAKAGYHYKIEKLFIPANAYDAEVPLILFRRLGLKDSLVTAQLEIMETVDFKKGYDDITQGSKLSRQTYKFSLTDKLAKPSLWDSFWKDLYGEYSNTKLLFLTSATGYRTWNTPVYLPQDQNQMVQSARLSLYEYEKANGPLIDENGNHVTLP